MDDLNIYASSYETNRVELESGDQTDAMSENEIYK